MPPKETDKFISRDNDFSMVLEINRLNSFNESWPFLENCFCTPKRMAEAGFYHCPTSEIPDGVRCFSCLKELDAWEPEDDPWKEHRKHTVEKGRDCEFMKLGKPQSELTVEEFLKIVKGRHICLIKMLTERNISDYEEAADKVRTEMQKLGKLIGK